MHRTIKRILTAHGFRDDFCRSPSFHLSIDNPPYTRLVIERIDSTSVSVAHYVEQNGDLCQDPEMTWRTSSGEGVFASAWTPMTFTQALVGVYQDAFPVIGDCTRVDTRLVRDLTHFARLWSGNLLSQGFHLPRCIVTSSSHLKLPALLPTPDSSSQSEGVRS